MLAPSRVSQLSLTSVTKYPGAMAFARMWSLANSNPMTLVSCMMAAFDTA
jgi:hypothetical protein